MAIRSIRSAESNPAAVRWLLPSIADLLFAALLALLAFTDLSVRLLGDAGIGWHIRTGQLILASHEIPRVDPFSSMAGQPWFAWEWLYDVVVGWLDRAAGLNGVVLLTALIIAGLFAWTFRLMLRRGTNVLVALVLVLLAVSAAMIHFQGLGSGFWSPARKTVRALIPILCLLLLLLRARGCSGLCRC